jgi:hypothetical protein
MDANEFAPDPRTRAAASPRAAAKLARGDRKRGRTPAHLRDQRWRTRGPREVRDARVPEAEDPPSCRASGRRRAQHSPVLERAALTWNGGVDARRRSRGVTLPQCLGARPLPATLSQRVTARVGPPTRASVRSYPDAAVSEVGNRRHEGGTRYDERHATAESARPKRPLRQR